MGGSTVMTHKNMNIIKTIIIGLTITAIQAVAEAPISFANLSSNETVQIIYTSTGCFHGHAYEFIVSGGSAPTIKAYSLTPNYFFEGDPPPKRSKDLGIIPLEVSDLTRLDALFEFYRTPKDDERCTTEEFITATLIRDGVHIAVESYKDSSCELPNDCLKLWDIHWQFTQKVEQIK